MPVDFQGEGQYDSQWEAFDDGFAAQAELTNGLLDEVLRLRACMERAKNGVGGTMRHFEEEGNSIGQAMMEGIYLDLDETLAGSVKGAGVE